jgi:hypothetical protein
MELLTAHAPGLRERIRDWARQRAVQWLGRAAIQAELDTLRAQKQELERRERQAHRALLAAVRRLPIAAVEDSVHDPPPEVSIALQQRQTIPEDELLVEDPLGQQLLQLRQEKDNSGTRSGWRPRRSRSRSCGRRSLTSWAMTRRPSRRKCWPSPLSAERCSGIAAIPRPWRCFPAGASDTACPCSDGSIATGPFTLSKEKIMIRLVVFVAGVVVGALGTLVVQHPQKVAQKLRAAAALVAKKARDAYPSGKPKADGPVDGPNPQAA